MDLASCHPMFWFHRLRGECEILKKVLPIEEVAQTVKHHAPVGSTCAVQTMKSVEDFQITYSDFALAMLNQVVLLVSEYRDHLRTLSRHVHLNHMGSLVSNTEYWSRMKDFEVVFSPEKLSSTISIITPHHVTLYGHAPGSDIHHPTWMELLVGKPHIRLAESLWCQQDELDQCTWYVSLSLLTLTFVETLFIPSLRFNLHAKKLLHILWHISYYTVRNMT